MVFFLAQVHNHLLHFIHQWCERIIHSFAFQCYIAMAWPLTMDAVPPISTKDGPSSCSTWWWCHPMDERSPLQLTDHYRWMQWEFKWAWRLITLLATLVRIQLPVAPILHDPTSFFPSLLPKVQVTATCHSSKTLLFRIPSWTKGATVQANGGTLSPASNGTLKAVQCQGSVSVKLTFPMSIQVQRRYNNAASMYYG